MATLSDGQMQYLLKSMSDGTIVWAKPRSISDYLIVRCRQIAKENRQVRGARRAQTAWEQQQQASAQALHVADFGATEPADSARPLGETDSLGVSADLETALDVDEMPDQAGSLAGGETDEPAFYVQHQEQLQHLGKGQQQQQQGEEDRLAPHQPHRDEHQVKGKLGQGDMVFSIRVSTDMT